VTEAWTDDAADDIPGDLPGDLPGDAADDIPGETDPAEEAGIPDEPEIFVEELQAEDAADVPETGEPRVDEVLSKLAGVENRPTSEHVGVYDEVHRGLQDALANLDQG
jgi:hypothetical protein